MELFFQINILIFYKAAMFENKSTKIYDIYKVKIEQQRQQNILDSLAMKLHKVAGALISSLKICG